jgi:septum formation protein
MSIDARLILASYSPRRSGLLREAGFNPIIHPADIDESVYPPDLTPTKLAEFLAIAKAKTVARFYPFDFTLGADTLVVLGSQVLGKPRDALHAKEMLTMLSGSVHQVISGVALVGPQRNFQKVFSVTSTVQMRPLSDSEIDQYVAGKQWEGKAGGYGIQDNDPFVTKMSGSLTNIVGLPIVEVMKLLASAGIYPVAPTRQDGTIFGS